MLVPIYTHIESDQDAALIKLSVQARQRGKRTSKAALIRDAIDLFLTTELNKTKRSARSYDVSTTDGSTPAPATEAAHAAASTLIEG